MDGMGSGCRGLLQSFGVADVSSAGGEKRGGRAREARGENRQAGRSDKEHVLGYNSHEEMNVLETTKARQK